MPYEEPAVAAPVSWVELDLEISEDEEEWVAAALWVSGSVGSWTIRPGLVRGYFDSRSGDVEERFRAGWRDATGEAWDRPLRSRGAARRDWLEQWRGSVVPVAVTPTLWVAPPGGLPPLDASSDARVIVIQPGQGFGTGSHATTRALLRWLEDEPGQRVLDVGCGSGVLGIAALALGARRAVGLDLDPDAIANADENRRRNRVEDGLMLVRGGPESLAAAARFDRVLANLDAPTLARLAGPLLARCASRGRIGVAGLLEGEREAFLASPLGRGARLLDERTDRDVSTGDAWWSGWLEPREKSG